MSTAYFVLRSEQYMVDHSVPGKTTSRLNGRLWTLGMGLLMFGLACFTLGLWEFTPLTHDWGWRELLLPQALRGFAQQFTVAPTVTLTLGSLAPNRWQARMASRTRPGRWSSRPR